MEQVRTDLYERIVDALMEGPATVSELAAECDVTVRAADEEGSSMSDHSAVREQIKRALDELVLALTSSRDCYAEETAMQVSEYVTRRHLTEEQER